MKNIDYLYHWLEELCIDGSINDIKLFFDKIKIDVNFADGYFLDLICFRDDVELLQLFIDQKANIHINNEGILRRAAHEGNHKILKFLLYNCNADYKELLNSSAYSNNKKSMMIINDYINSLVIP